MKKLLKDHNLFIELPMYSQNDLEKAFETYDHISNKEFGLLQHQCF